MYINNKLWLWDAMSCSQRPDKEVMHRGWARVSKKKLASTHKHRQANRLACLAQWRGTGHVVVCMDRVGMSGGVGGIKL